ncbi:hypothetical protein, partial [Streptomyces sp. NPDC002067]
GPGAPAPDGPALRPVPAAAAAVSPPAAPRPPASREIGGFDFFGNTTPPALSAPMEEDLADVVGDEAIAEQTVRAAARLRPAEPEPASGTGSHRRPGPVGAEAGTVPGNAPGAGTVPETGAPEAAAPEAGAQDGPAPAVASVTETAEAGAETDAEADAVQPVEPEGAAAADAEAEAPAADGAHAEAPALDGAAPDGDGPEGTAAEDAADKDATEKDGVGEVIDLTAHDETEQLDLAGLRTAIS